MRAVSRTLALAAAALGLAAQASPGAELATLDPENWREFAPRGKEVDAIYGDVVLRNDRIVAVVARPVDTRNANMTIRNVGGCLIDLTRRDRPSDQLGALYPGGQQYVLRHDGVSVVNGAAEEIRVNEDVRLRAQGEAVTLRLAGEPKDEGLAVAVTYTLADDADYLTVETTFINKGEAPIGVELFDTMRADRSFEKGPDARADLFWVYDPHFGQAYGVAAPDHAIQANSDPRSSNIRYLADGKARISLEPGQSYQLVRRIIPGASLVEVKGLAAALAGEQTRPVEVNVRHASGSAVADATITVTRDGEPYASGRTDREGTLAFLLPSEGRYSAIVSALGSPEQADLSLDGEALDVTLEDPGVVVATITNADGGPTPCKVQFLGKDGTDDPNFGPDSGDHGVQNVYYSHNGQFRQPIGPGTYDVIVSYGPEHDAVFTSITVSQGAETSLKAKLVRSVDTSGWISSDFHSHSSPSGDNTASQYGRVLNLLCEQIDFAPCTEHNRISTYVPHLRRMGAERLMATCTGMELTGGPLPLNHQNAFPLEMKPRTQDGGAPVTDADPEVQIERLAFWDNKSDKLVQVNHPDIGWMFYDRDGDFEPDEGYAKMAGLMDVIEIHPPQSILSAATQRRNDTLVNNRAFNWLQLLNQGHRIPGVVNTDAHYNFHGSGWLRNWLKSPTDDPAEIETMDVVHAAEAGHVIMSNGPFLRVSLRAADGGSEAIPGADLSAPGGKGELRVQVQCPNWFDINRVQVLLNGRPAENLNFTREATPDRFGSGAVKFEQTLPLALEGDTHVIVVAIGEGLKLGPVMGPSAGEAPPVAVSNPIYVDVDGNGFTPNRDTLGAPLPVKGGRPIADAAR